jgi:putative nucleotidyltransferase with HDIG domain
LKISLSNNSKEQTQSKNDHIVFQSLISNVNYSRSRMLTFVIFITSLLLLITDYFNFRNGLWTTLPGYRYLFYAHLLLAAGMLSLIPMIYFCRCKNPNHIRWRRVFVLLFSYFVTFNCSLTSISDQMINGEMTVFIMGVLTFAIINYYKPLTSFLMYFFTSTIFIIGVTAVQKDAAILRSQYINGTIITLLSWVLAVILYQAKANDFSSKRTIEEQKDVLEKVNMDLHSTINKLQDSLSALDESQNVIVTLVLALESKDTYSSGHSKRVAEYALEIARYLNLSETTCVYLYRAAILHDIGKIGIPDAILNKPCSLTPDEWMIMKSHSERGEMICSKLNFAKEILPIIRFHHERYDGSGYPDGLCGEDIPFLARIVSLADTVDSITSSRSYRSSSSMDKALEELRKFSGTQFDPSLVKVFIDIYDDRDIHKSKPLKSIIL